MPDKYLYEKLVEEFGRRYLSEIAVSTSIKENLLVKRNKNWIPKIEQLIQQKTCFIAVGAGHLAGENGILELLRKQGFTVEPISIN